MASPQAGPSCPGIYQSTGYTPPLEYPQGSIPYPTSSWPGIQSSPVASQSKQRKHPLPPISTNVQGPHTQWRPAAGGYEGWSGNEHYPHDPQLVTLQRKNATHGSVGEAELVCRARAASRRSQHGFYRRDAGEKYFGHLE